MRKSNLSRSLVTSAALAVLLVLLAGIAVAVGAAQPALPGSLQVEYTFSPGTVHRDAAVSGSVAVHNQSAEPVVLDAVSAGLPEGLTYAGQAFGSDVIASPEREGATLHWAGPWEVPAGETLTVRYWAVVVEALPGQYASQVAISLDGETYEVAGDALLVQTAPVEPVEEQVPTGGLPMAPAAIPGITVTKTADPTQAVGESAVTYTVVFANSSTSARTLNTITDVLPEPFDYVGLAAGNEVPYEPTDTTEPTIVWQGSFTVPAQGTLTLRYLVWIPHTTEYRPEPYVNSVTAASGGSVTEPASAPVTVQSHYLYMPFLATGFRPPYFEVTKSVSAAEVVEGEEVVYTVEFTNPSSEPGQLDTVYDNLPAGFTFLQMEGGDVSTPPTGSTGTIYWDLPTATGQVGPKESLTLSFRVQVGEAGTYVNEATATTIVGRAPAEPARATVVVKEPFLLWEDFESGTDGWAPFLNYWRLNEQQWYLKGKGGYDGSAGIRHTYWLGVSDPDRGAHDAIYMYQGAGSDEWTDYRVETKIRSDARGVLGLWVRGKYIPSELSGHHVEGYYVTWQADRNRGIDLFRLRTEGSTAYHFSDPLILVSGGPEMKKYTWYTLAVEVRGSNIKIFVDGALALEHNDSTFSSGTVGFVGYKMEDAAFDNVLVTSLD